MWPCAPCLQPWLPTNKHQQTLDILLHPLLVGLPQVLSWAPTRADCSGCSNNYSKNNGLTLTGAVRVWILAAGRRRAGAVRLAIPATRRWWAGAARLPIAGTAGRGLVGQAGGRPPLGGVPAHGAGGILSTLVGTQLAAGAAPFGAELGALRTRRRRLVGVQWVGAPTPCGWQRLGPVEGREGARGGGGGGDRWGGECVMWMST
jgi:hypothetical protein